MESFVSRSSSTEQRKPLQKKERNSNFLEEIQKTKKVKENAAPDTTEELKGNLENVVDFFKRVREHDNVKNEIQQLVFSEVLPKKPYRLIEVSKKMAEDFKQGQELVFRGGHDDYAVLCTENKTYDVKEVETSNSLLLVPYLHDSSKMTDDGEKTLVEQEIVMLSHKFLELKEIECVSVYRLRELLHENELRWHWEIEDKDEHRYSFGDLLNVIRMSEGQLKDQLAKMPVIEHQGFLRWLSYEFRDNFIEAIISLADDSLKERVNVDKVTFGSLRENLPCNVLNQAISWFLRTYCTELEDDKDVYKMEPRPLVRSRASYILRNVSSLDVAVFERELDESLPVGIELDYAYLDGIAIINETFKGKTISYLNVEDLPEEPRERLRILFDRKSTWRMSEISPYLVDICSNTKAMSGLMVSNCRATKDETGDKVFCSMRPV